MGVGVGVGVLLGVGFIPYNMIAMADSTMQARMNSNRCTPTNEGRAGRTGRIGKGKWKVAGDQANEPPALTTSPSA